MIPAELTSRPQWVTWRYETRDKKPTKVPYRPSGQRASSTDPKTWTSFEQANAAAKRFDGIGFVFAKDDPYTGVDFDGVIDPDTGEVHPDAAELVQELNSYTELSPSRTGAHVLVKATKNGFPHSSTSKTLWEKKFEVYDQGRFFTFTGKRLNERGIEPRQAELDRVLRRIWPEPAPQQDDASAPKRGPAPKPELLKQWRKRPRFADLLSRPVDDQSERDYAIACLALEHRAEAEEAKRLMQAARLETAGDAKAMRADYLERTIARARDKVRDKSSDKLLKELSKRLGLGERRVIAVDLYGRGSNAVAYIHLADGDRIVFDTVGKVTTIGKMTAELALQAGAQPKLSATAVIRVLVLLHDLARHHDEHEAEDRAEELGMDFLRDVDEAPVRMDDQADRWRAFAELDGATAYVDGHFTPQGAWVLRDTTTRTRYVRTGWFASYVRQRAGPGEAAVAMRAMLRIGWRKPNTEGRVKATAPERAAKRSFKFFQVPDMWEER